MSFYSDRIFPHVLDIATRPFWPQRKEVIGEAYGRVLEIGIGTGANLPHYSAQVTEIVGIEPDEALLERVRSAATALKLPAPLVLAIGDAQALDYPDESFDTVLMCLVLCTIPDPLKALQEARRVLKPGGQVIFLEHVRSPDTGVAKWQDCLTPAWKVLGCGCHLNRDTAAAFKQAGFHFHRIRRYEHPKMMRLSSAIIQGVAIK